MNRFPVFVAISLAAITSIVGPSVAREGTVMVGGAAMYPSKNIVQNAVHSRDHTTLVAAVKAAGLVDTLSGAGHSRFSLQPTPHSTSSRQAPLKAW